MREVSDVCDNREHSFGRSDRAKRGSLLDFSVRADSSKLCKMYLVLVHSLRYYLQPYNLNIDGSCHYSAHTIVQMLARRPPVRI